MHKLWIFALTVVVVTAFALPAAALRAPDTVMLDVSGQAPVAFDHAAHVVAANGCKDCHHYGVGNGSCSGCHGKTDLAPTLADAYTKCKTCHTSAPAPTPAASCSDYSEMDSCLADPACRWNGNKGNKGKCRAAR